MLQLKRKDQTSAPKRHSPNVGTEETSLADFCLDQKTAGPVLDSGNELTTTTTIDYSVLIYLS